MCVSRNSVRFMILLTVLDEDALVLRPRGRGHHNLYILDTRGLARWPVNTCCTQTGRDTCQVQLQVSDLPEEHICGRPTLIAITLVLVTVNQAKSSKACSGFDGRHRVRIADELGKVVVNDRRGDQVGSCREVYDGGRRGRGFSARRAESTPSADSRVDGSCIVRHSVTYTTR